MKPHPIVLCGGEGSRLWPLSYGDLQKPFLKPYGHRSFFQETILRLNDDRFHPPICVGQTKHRDILLHQLEALNIHDYRLILEDPPQGTLMALTLAVEYLYQKDPESIFLEVPSDHHFDHWDFIFEGVHSFLESSRDFLVVFGEKIQQPDPGLGHIKISPESNHLKSVEHFVEKPNYIDAFKMSCSPEYLWNMGIYLGTSRVYLQEVERWNPEIIQVARKAIAQPCDPKSHCLSVTGAIPAYVDPLSIDRGLSEKTSLLKCFEVSHSGWKDLGTWPSLKSLLLKQDTHPTIGNNISSEGSEHCLLVNEAPSKILRTKNLSHTIVAVSEQGVWVEGTLGPWFEERPWGKFSVVDREQGYQIKKIDINPGQSLSLQRHCSRTEIWLVVLGAPTVTCGEKILEAQVGDVFKIQPLEDHRLENKTDGLCRVIEIQYGELLEEEDIERLEDCYGRA